MSIGADFSVMSLSERFVVSFKGSSDRGSSGMPVEEVISLSQLGTRCRCGQSACSDALIANS
jgi:hypothetical protein